jgi:gamma-glutamylcyclotransferase (GGCT)/AIG2-like uncharacterized protein YtfP
VVVLQILFRHPVSIYTLTEFDLELLDHYEGYYGKGYENAYDRKVFTESIKGKTTKVRVYVVRVKKKGLVPSKKYMEGIIHGAISNNLPKEYINSLEKIKVK